MQISNMVRFIVCLENDFLKGLYKMTLVSHESFQFLLFHPQSLSFFSYLLPYALWPPKEKKSRWLSNMNIHSTYIDLFFSQQDEMTGNAAPDTMRKQFFDHKQVRISSFL